MERDKPVCISLTSKNSHKVTIQPGVGSFSISTKGISKGKCDVIVEKDAIINWDAFNKFYTPHGKTHYREYPNGDWPRVFYYHGNDQGFVNWSFKRNIEDFNWYPTENTFLDLTKANIGRFLLNQGTYTTTIDIGDKINSIFFKGHLENITINKCIKTPYLYFHPILSKRNLLPYSLPEFKLLHNATSIDITVEPIGQAFNCESLLQFPHIKNLNLSGNFTNWEALKNLKEIQTIAVRFSPDLKDFPPLSTWKKLNSFIGWNIEETIGKELNIQLKTLAKQKELEYSSVSQLRKKIWFKNEYGMPFSSWENKTAKIAIKAYKEAVKEIKKSKTENEVQNAIITFVKIINSLPNIETSEREDAGIAIEQLVENSALNISQEKVHKWFDETRDF